MRVLSYNIHKGIGGRDRLYRLERIIEVIEEENPDLICLQEVDSNVRRSKHHDQPQILADYFKFDAAMFQLNVKLKTGGYGNLLLSRWPIESQHQISLRLKKRKPRGAQSAVIQSPEGPFQLINWHLGLLEQERRWQVKHFLDHEICQECCELPAMVIGDFNDWRNTLANAVFAHGNFTQVTAPVSRFRSFPAYMAVGSLDKAFVRGDVHIRHAKIVRTRMSKVASDHLPLVIDFHIGEDALEKIAHSKPSDSE
ncbi:endonuclease/exonuclease/phosphatase family protein [Thalassoroseus pseudoceratinae]|uniref:endonuclease/exonuclease/phosphatase family protein n=1 Tax=Thalassoroseus pseudoceratinae TaxID=2713176 RepID=UPI001422620F|nr:endonuclease/exonuclease/phosphatase family protein [Thalassoroseus pseudoceratinae]